MMSRARLLAVSLASLGLLLGCSDRDGGPISPGSGGTGLSRSQDPLSDSHQTVELPAGSVDGLAAAIAAAGSGGTVIVKTGTHAESGTVMITDRVTIRGEAGAIMTFDTSPAVGPTGRVDPALHILGASKVKVEGLEMRPLGPIGGTAILIEDSPKTSIEENSIHDYQFGVLIEGGDHTEIEENTIAASTAWLTGVIGESDGIIAGNGSHIEISHNTVSGGLFGLFGSGSSGRMSGNTVTGNFIGIILCNLIGVTLPDGSSGNAEITATRWLVKKNTASNNFDAGYLVIDGANNNVLVDNRGSNNGTYDIELVGDSSRFGFFTPTSFQNRVVSKKKFKGQPPLVIKDCGLDNKVIGGDLVDTSLDPCF